jgi:AmmeMemoRadiSam system protein B
MEGPVRKSVVAGSWYPGDPEALKKDISRYFSSARIPDIADKPVSVISPHAGYMYSGHVAACAYKTLLNRTYSTVVVISPSHRAYFPFISVWPKGAYETPFGLIEIDEALCSRLLSSGDIQDNASPHAGEHALEIQLPFLQHVLQTFKLCPLIMGMQDLSLCESLAESLHKSIKDPDNTLIVASSDLSHFHSSRKAEEMDQKIQSRIESFDIAGLSLDLERSSSEACGGGPILAALLYGRKLARNHARVLKYAHSGHITGDNSSVVGYLAAVVY